MHATPSRSPQCSLSMVRRCGVARCERLRGDEGPAGRLRLAGGGGADEKRRIQLSSTSEAGSGVMSGTEARREATWTGLYAPGPGCAERSFSALTRHPFLTRRCEAGGGEMIGIELRRIDTLTGLYEPGPRCAARRSSCRRVVF